jgi:Domain of unknown function (DUF4783)
MILVTFENHIYTIMILKKYLSVLFLFFTISVFADTFDDVALAIKNSNQKEVSKYFNQTVELTILDNEGVYSKPQAEVMLKNFFAQNPPTNVAINHRGSSTQGAKYATAIYEYSKGKFRIYIYMKESTSGMMIQELRIEKE